MKTILLWGNRWWLPGQADPLVCNESAAAALAAAWPESASRHVRLVYQPDDLASVLVTCPKGDRRTLALALGDQYPALASAEQAWGFEPILPLADRFSTVLYYEPEPRLLALVEELAGHGFAVSSVVPLPTWLEFVPRERSESGAFAVLIATADRASGFCHECGGVRTAPTWTGAEAASAAAAFARDFLAKNSAANATLIAADETAALALDPGAEAEASAGLEALPLGEALERNVVVPAKHPAQLLPPTPRLTAPRAVAAASIAFLLIATAIGGRYGYACWHHDPQAREAQKKTLRREVAHLRANAKEIAELRAQRGNEGSGKLPIGRFLRELSPLPPEIALRTLRLTREGIHATGWTMPATGSASLERWLRQQGSQRGWQFTPSSPAPNGALELRGRFL